VCINFYQPSTNKLLSHIVSLVAGYTTKECTLRSVCERWCSGGPARTYIKPSDWKSMASWSTCLRLRALLYSTFSGQT